MINTNLIKRITSKFYKIILLPISLIIFVFIIIIRPLKLIKICKMPSSRFGHFIGNTEIFLSYKQLALIDETIIFFLKKPTANIFVEKMIKKKILVFPEEIMSSIFLILNKLKFLNFFKCHLFDLRAFDRDIDNILLRTSLNLSLNLSENTMGSQFLKKMGLTENDKFICLVNRESNYLKKKNLNYINHEYRNSNIFNYKLACEEILKKNYFIFRMGRNVEPIAIANDKFIDYANSKFCNDFLDVYLASKCEFAFGDSDGWIMAPISFRKPVGLVNWFPAGVPYLHNNNLIYLFKHYYDMKSKKNLTLREIFEKDLAFEIYSKKFSSEYEIKQNSPEEIRDLVCELIMKQENQWKDQMGDEILIEKFNKIILENSTSERWGNKEEKKLHNKILGRYSMNFLRLNNQWVN